MRAKPKKIELGEIYSENSIQLIKQHKDKI